MTPELLIGLEVVVAAVVLWLLRPTIARRIPAGGRVIDVIALAGVLIGGAIVVLQLTTDRTPLSARQNPVPRTVDSITAGAGLFEANCAACHGVDGRGGGVQSGITPVRPPSLVSGHLNSHTDGDIFYWMSEGLPGGMPAFAGRLSETDRWHLVNYLRSLNGQPPVR